MSAVISGPPSPSRSETGDADHPIRVGSSETLLVPAASSPSASDATAAPSAETAAASSTAVESKSTSAAGADAENSGAGSTSAAAAAAAELAARNEQLMMRQDASAATLLSPGKGHQGLPLYIPLSQDHETPMGEWLRACKSV